MNPSTPLLSLPTELSAGELLLIKASIGSPARLVAELTAALSAAERERASKYFRPVDALRHTLGRGILRHALSRLMDLPASDIVFEIEPAAGKPYVTGAPAFNVSHSGDLVLVALGREGRIGVDVEAVRPVPDLESVARTSFTRDEVDALFRFPAGETRTLAFFRGWTRKEAMLKALGHGIGSLDRISVALTEGDGNALLRLDVVGETRPAWTVRSVRAAASHEAAIAWDRPLQGILCIEP